VLEIMIFIVYVSLLIAWAFGFIQYIRHVRWHRWLPFLLGKSAAAFLVIWRYYWSASFESLDMELVSVSYSLVIVCLFLFAAQSLIGWWFWTCARLIHRSECSLPSDARRRPTFWIGRLSIDVVRGPTGHVIERGSRLLEAGLR
jgi:hypothetical protein